MKRPISIKYAISAAVVVCAAIGCNADQPAAPSSTKRPTKQESQRDASRSEPGADATASPQPQASAAGMAAPKPARTEDAAVAQQQDADCASGTFDSTFAAIQKVVFAGNKCTNDTCHGAAAVGGLDLRPDAAYKSLVEVKSTSSSLQRVMPGRPDESFLYNKLRAATEPGSVMVEGSPMPSGAPALSTEHLEVIRRWIETGAPREGSVGDSVTGQSDKIAALLGSCLPKATPVQIAALEAPAADEGVQFAMPSFNLKAGTSKPAPRPKSASLSTTTCQTSYPQSSKTKTAA
jgi:hypothetical protein